MKNLRKFISILLTLVLLMAVPVNAVDADARPVFHTVTFDTDGGSEINAQKVLHGDCVIRPDDPVKEGYMFLGWKEEGEGAEDYDFSAPVYSDLTLCAGWENVYIRLLLDADNSPDNVVSRNVSGCVYSNSPISSVEYTLTSANKTEAGYPALGEGNDFSIDLLLENGKNILKVTAATPDGSTTSESIELNYDSGYVFTRDYPADDPRLIRKPVWFSDETSETSEGPDAYLVANVLDLYFSDETSFEDRKDFVEITLGGKMVGYLNSLDMMEVLLPDTLVSDEKVSYAGERSLADITEEELREYADALVSAYDGLNSVSFEHFYNFDLSQATSTDGWDGDKSRDWWLDMIEAYDAWDYDDSCGRDFLTDTTIGVVDSGFQDDHPDLTGRISILSEVDTPRYHGTHVAGIMAATADNGTEGIAGIMHNNASLVGYDVAGEYSDAEYFDGLTKTVEAGAKAINYSQGCAQQLTGVHMSDASIKYYGEEYSKAIGILLEKGSDFLVIQSAGNGNEFSEGLDYVNNGFFCSITQENCYKSSKVSQSDIMDRIIVVSAVSESGSADHGSTLCPWSDGGSGDLCEIAAPGADVFSTVCKNTKPAYQDGGYALLSGTSMAAPMVTAVCALTWSVNPSLTGSEVRQLVEDNCSDGTAATNTSTWTDKNNNIRSSHTTGGMHILNAKRAVEAAVMTRPEIYGYIADKKTDAPVPAQIEIHKGTAADGEQVGDLISDTEIYQFVADASGKVTLPRLPSGKYTLVVSAEGYYNSEKTITVVDGGVLIDAATVAKDFGKIRLTSAPVVEFETNGGSPVSSQVVDYGYTVAKPADPEKTGYDFGGWYTDKNCTDPFDFSTPITEDITLYAKWILKEFTVTWVIDGKEEKETYLYGTTPSHADPEKAADAQYTYTFREWTPAVETVTGDAAYTAVFDETHNHYTVTWIVDGRTENELYAYGETPRHAVPEKPGSGAWIFVFSGWAPSVEPVTGDAVYAATFAAVRNPFFPKPEEPTGGDPPASVEEPGAVPSGTVELPFTDVTPDSPFFDDIQFVYGNDLMIGMSDTEFGENLPLTRGMIVTVLHRMEGKPDVAYTGVFTDVPGSEWFTDGVEWAASHGIVLGYGDGCYGPGDLVTREQLATILHRYAKYKGCDVSIGEDTNILSYYDAFTWSDWAVSALQWACGAGVLEDVPVGMLRPTDDATRGEIAHAIRIFCEEVAK